jgi:uncharacterized protein (TIGR04255 family)
VIVEALCEIHFSLPDGHAWSESWYGDLFSSIVADFPKMEPQQLMTFHARVHAGGMTPSMSAPSIRMRYRHKSGSQLLQLQPNVVTTNWVGAYTGWEHFREAILSNWAKVCNTLPVGSVERVGLRYINRIERTSRSETVGDWLESSQFLSESLRQCSNAFSSRYESPTDAGFRRIIGVAEGQAPDFPIIFDIDIVSIGKRDADTASLQVLVDHLHSEEWNVFQSALSEKLRQQMDEVQSES